VDGWASPQQFEHLFGLQTSRPWSGKWASGPPDITIIEAIASPDSSERRPSLGFHSRAASIDAARAAPSVATGRQRWMRVPLCLRILA
jgi:hypothetical protein